MRSLVVAVAAVAVLPASPAVAAGAKIKPGTYKVTSSSGQKLKMVVASCGKAKCLSTAPSQGSENEIHLSCVNTSGGGDGVSDYSDFGPQRISSKGKIRTSSKQPDDDNTQTRTYSWTLTSKGKLTGSARLSEKFADGGTCDSGTVTFKGRLTK